MSEVASSRAPKESFVTLPETEPPYPAILDFLDRRFPNVGRDVWRLRLETGAVRDDQGSTISAETPYASRLRLRYRREVPEEPVMPFEETVLFRNDLILAADKPHFMPVTPSGPWVNGCLLYRLMRSTGCADLVPVHRLDRETAGVVLFSANPATRRAYGLLVLRGGLKKRYEAIARIPPDGRAEWEVASRIEKGEPWFRMRETEGAVNARTRIRLVEKRGERGRFEIEPLSGKQHQIRLHMARIGAPIAHDWLYPELQPEPKSGFDRPLMLLARELAFTDPVSGEARVFRSARELAWPAE